MLQNNPKPNEEYYLYVVKISEEAFNTKLEFVKKITNDIEIGFITSKAMPSIPRFKLYRENSQFYISIIDTGKKVVLDVNQYDKLKKYFLKIFNEMFKIKHQFNFEDPIYGGLFVVLQKDKLEVDWDYLNSLNLEDETAYDIYSKDNNGFIELSKNSIWLFRSQVISIKGIENSLTPASEFPNKALKSHNFKDYFKTKYELDTIHDNSPLVEVTYVSKNMNFILRSQNHSIQKNKKQPNYKILLIMEHLKHIPVKPNQTFKFSMFPSIFYRLDCILRARKLQLIIQNEMKLCLGLENVTNEKLIWDDSLKFHRIKDTKTLEEQNEVESSPNSDEIKSNDIFESDESDDEYSKIFNQMPKDDELMVMQRIKFSDELDSNQTQLITPPLLIKEKTDTFVFPNAFNVLQCLTLKSACDNFDLERYEVLGDCFLKLIVVMKIYVDFSNTSEGKMVSLKSARVSNNYLYKLAVKKNLNEYIVWQSFMPESTWIPPNLDKTKFLEDSIYKTKLADKSLADCVEALIGLYLIYLGSNAAKAFIEWLDFRISDKLGKANFTQEYNLPNPALVYDENHLELLSSRYSEFEQSIGYEFKNKFYILQAFTHPSDLNNRYTSSYEK